MYNLNNMNIILQYYTYGYHYLSDTITLLSNTVLFETLSKLVLLYICLLSQYEDHKQY